MMRLLMTMMLLFTTLACRAEMEPEAPRWDLPQLMQRLAQVKSAKGNFVEKKYLSILNAPLESTGTLSYQAPGRLEKHTLTPKTESLVLDGDALVIESSTRGKRSLALQDYPALWAFIESIRSTLAGDLATLGKFYQVSLEGDARRWSLILLPSDAKTREMVREIRIAGRGDWVAEIKILETNGDHSVMTVSEDKGVAP